MAEEFEGDLRDASFWGADLRGAVFRDVDLSGARISHARLIDVRIDATVERLEVNGVDVTDLVNAGDEWYPLRTMLRVPDVVTMRKAWDELERAWADTIALAEALPDELRHAAVDGEWSFVETLRHVVFAIDKWLTAPVLGDGFHPIGLPNRGSMDFPWPGLDAAATPSFSEAVAVRADRAERVRAFLASADRADLHASVDVLENGPSPLEECLFTVQEEAFWHNRYARRDLTRLVDDRPS